MKQFLNNFMRNINISSTTLNTRKPGKTSYDNLKTGINTMSTGKMTSTLYKKHESPPARAVMMTLDLMGLEVNMEDLNPVARDQDEPKFVKMNPMRTIPIYDEGDFSLGDSHAIMIYLLEKYGKKEHEYLYPRDIRKRATIHQRLFLEAGIIFPRLRAVMSPTYFGRLTELTKFMKANIEDVYQMLEDILAHSEFMAGEHLTIADLSIFTTAQSMDVMHPADEKRFPKLRKWFKSMAELDVVKRINEPFGVMHGQTLLKLMELNRENQKAKL